MVKPGIGRVLKAFVKAAAMTLRGEKVVTPEAQVVQRYPKLSAWIAGTLERVEAVEQAAAGTSFNEIVVKADRREMRARVLLDTIRYHAREEYPYMLRNESRYNLLGIQATNLNDRYLVLQLLSAESLPSVVKSALALLRDHLDGIPTEDPPNPSKG